jgi:hypothetical protein
MLPGFFVVVGPDERLTIVADTLGIPGALRFRTRGHAEAWLEKHYADASHGRVRRDFGPGDLVS